MLPPPSYTFLMSPGILPVVNPLKDKLPAVVLETIGVRVLMLTSGSAAAVWDSDSGLLSAEESGSAVGPVQAVNTSIKERIRERIEIRFFICFAPPVDKIKWNLSLGY